MAPGIPLPQSAVLTSWKEIANYLGKGVRTVQRREFQFGLPVRRPNPGSHSVYISRNELNEWLVKRWSQRPRNLEISTPSNGAKTGKADIEEHRKLRSDRCQLMGEVRRNLGMLAEMCQTLSQPIARPLFSLFADQSTKASPPANKAKKSPRKKHQG